MRTYTCCDCGQPGEVAGGGRLPTRCKSCYWQDQRNKNRARDNEARKAYRAANPLPILQCRDCGVDVGSQPTKGRPKERCSACSQVRILAQQRDDYRRNGDKRRAQNLAGHYRKKYGITIEDRDRMLDLQGGKCAICLGGPNGNPNKKGARLHVDHCHTSNRIRGLLCYTCNTMLGLANDDPARLLAAAEYLNR